MKIKNIKAREILSAGSYPTLETKVTLENGVSGIASVPFGSSAGKYEALSLVDNDRSRYQGFGVKNAIKNVDEVISAEIVGMDVQDQVEIDKKLIELDSSPRKEKLGGNAILSVSLACMRTAANNENTDLYRQIATTYDLNADITKLPKPMVVLIEGGKHADNSTDFQEYLATVVGEYDTKEAVRAVIEVYHELGKILKSKKYNINVGLEGAYAPDGIGSNEEPLALLTDAIEKTGNSNNMRISMDPAASEFYENNSYKLAVEDKSLSSTDMVNYYKEMVARYSIFSIEDGLDQDDWTGWGELFKITGDKIMIVGDDLTVTNKDRLQKAITQNVINAIIIKPNQVGTLSETMDTILLAKDNNIKTIVSHRGGGETTDTFIIDLAVAVGSDFVKVGPSRGERVVKYNRLMEIADDNGC